MGKRLRCCQLESNEIETIESKSQINHSKEIIFDLLKGHHIFQGPQFNEVKQNQDFYEKIFDLMDLELICHQREFYYLLNNSASAGKNSTSIALIFFVLLRTVSIAENNPRPNLFRSIGFEESILRLDNLAPNDRGILEESGITSWIDLERKLALMERLGFINRFPDEDRFVFNSPAYRLIELCESYIYDEALVAERSEEE